MQYVSFYTSEDLMPGHATVCLQRNDDRIDLLAYVGGNPENKKWLDYYTGAKFMRKGFLFALGVNPEVLTPVYIDKDRKEVFPESIQEAKYQIYHKGLSISGFRYNPTASEKEKREAFKDLIDVFVRASQNPDFLSENYLFGIQSNQYGLLYNNGGSPDVKITPEDIEKRLLIDMSPAEIRKLRDFQSEI